MSGIRIQTHTILNGSDFELITEIRNQDSANYEGNLYKYFEIGDVTRDGAIVRFREDYFEKLPTRARLQVNRKDIIFAKNNSSRGTTVLIPDWFDGGLVTTGFIGIRPKDQRQGLILWNILVSEFFRKQVYYLAITASQPEVRENIFKQEMIIPWPKTKTDEDKMVNVANSVAASRNNLRASLETATNMFDNLIQRIFGTY